jgi:large subunit ribosomal protein L25
MTETNIIKSVKREITGSAESRRLRKNGLIPATIYYNNGNLCHISVDQREFNKKYFAGNIFSSPISLELDGKIIEVISDIVATHSVSDLPIHIDCNEIENGKEIKVRVKFDFINQDKSAALKRGGFLHKNLRMIEIICNSPDFIPEKIDIDVSTLSVGDKIRTHSINLPENTRLKSKKELLIASIIGRSASKDAEEGDAEEGESDKPAESAEK